jgi:hypothetical protein
LEAVIGKETSWVASISNSGKINYTDSTVERTFPGTKLKEGFVT